MLAFFIVYVLEKHDVYLIAYYLKRFDRRLDLICDSEKISLESAILEIFFDTTRQISRGLLLGVAKASLCRYMKIKKMKKCLEVQDSHPIFAV